MGVAVRSFTAVRDTVTGEACRVLLTAKLVVTPDAVRVRVLLTAVVTELLVRVRVLLNATDTFDADRVSVCNAMLRVVVIDVTVFVFVLSNVAETEETLLV
jgi:hypothetical protein